MRLIVLTKSFSRKTNKKIDKFSSQVLLFFVVLHLHRIVMPQGDGLAPDEERLRHHAAANTLHDLQEHKCARIPMRNSYDVNMRREGQT